MPKYQIEDHEINKVVVVTAPGIIEAIADYLPWPSVEVEVNWCPTKGVSTVIDKQTDFKYTINLI